MSEIEDYRKKIEELTENLDDDSLLGYSEAILNILGEFTNGQCADCPFSYEVESYSPDFMYVVKKSDGNKILNIIVETKDVKDESDLRKIETVKIDCAKKFFKQLTIDGYSVAFHEQINNKKMKQIIEDVFEE